MSVGKQPRKPLLRRTRLASSGITRGKPIKPKKRKPSEFARIYGSRARVAFVKSLRCIAGHMWCVGPIENAHIETGGTGRKADADKIVPACQYHHEEMHRGIRTFAAKYHLDLPALAADTEARWQAYQLNRSTAA